MAFFAPKIRITGHEDVDKVLRGIEPKLVKKILRKYMRKSLQPMLDYAVAGAPVGPSWVNDKKGIVHQGGMLKRSIKIKASKSSKGPRLAIMVGAKGDFKPTGFYPAAIVYGAGGKGKGPRGPIKPNKFMREAFDTTHPEVQADTVESVRANLDELVKP